MERGPLRAFRNNESGQTIVEYLLLLLVMVTVISSLLITLKTKYFGDITKCDKPSNSKTLLCQITKIISPDPNAEKKFQYFPFKK